MSLPSGKRFAQVAFRGHHLRSLRFFCASSSGSLGGERPGERKPYVYVDYSHLKKESIYSAPLVTDAG